MNEEVAALIEAVLVAKRAYQDARDALFTTMEEGFRSQAGDAREQELMARLLDALEGP